jgi:hypothetical protein
LVEVKEEEQEDRQEEMLPLLSLDLVFLKNLMNSLWHLKKDVDSL